MSEQQKKWIKQMEDERAAQDDEHDHEKWVAKQRHILETEFRLRITADAGEEPDPEDFEVPEILQKDDLGGQLVTPHGSPAGNQDNTDDEEEEDNPDFKLKPFDEQEQNSDDDGGNDDGSNVATAPPPEPPPNFWDDPYAHPLADSYRVYATITENGLFHHAYRTLDTLCDLMGRKPDEYYPAPPSVPE